MFVRSRRIMILGEGTAKDLCRMVKNPPLPHWRDDLRVVRLSPAAGAEPGPPHLQMDYD